MILFSSVHADIIRTRVVVHIEMTIYLYLMVAVHSAPQLYHSTDIINLSIASSDIFPAGVMLVAGRHTRMHGVVFGTTQVNRSVFAGDEAQVRRRRR